MELYLLIFWGVFSRIINRSSSRRNLILIIGTGLLGSLTTFSTLNKELYSLQKYPKSWLMYFLATYVGGFVFFLCWIFLFLVTLVERHTSYFGSSLKELLIMSDYRKSQKTKWDDSHRLWPLPNLPWE